VRLKTLVRVHTAALVLTLSLGPVSHNAIAGPPPSSTFAAIHIDNFGQISPAFFRGAQPQGGDYTDLAGLGVKAIINLTSDDAAADERAMAEKAGLTYFQIPMTTHIVPTVAQLTEFMKIVNDPVNQPVYVHCVGGRHRTGVMTAAYRIAHDGWTADRAFKEMKQYKFGADFLHSEFKQFVYSYAPEMLHADAAVTTPAVTRKTGGQ